MPPRPRPIRPPGSTTASPAHATAAQAPNPASGSTPPVSIPTPKDAGSVTSKAEAASTPAVPQSAPTAADTVASVVSTVVSEVPATRKTFLGDEVEQLNNAFKAAAIKAGDIMRYQAHVRKSKLVANVPRVPYTLASSLALELEKFDEVCDVIETSLLRAYGVIAAEIERRKTDIKQTAMITSPPPESARSASSPPLPLSQLVGNANPPSAPLSRHTSPRPATAAGPRTRPVPPPLKTNLSGSAIRPSAVHLSALPTSDGPRLRPGLNLDLSATKLFGVNPDMLASPVTLAPKSKAQNSPPVNPGALPPELLSALQQQQTGQAQNLASMGGLGSPVRIQATISPQRQPMQMPLQPMGGVMPLLSTANMMGRPGGEQTEPMDISMDFLNVGGGAGGEQGLGSDQGGMDFLGVNSGVAQAGSDVGNAELENFLNTRPSTAGMDIPAPDGVGGTDSLFGDMGLTNGGQQAQGGSMIQADNDAAIAGILASIGGGDTQSQMADAGGSVSVQGVQAAPAFGAEDGSDLLASFANVGTDAAVGDSSKPSGEAGTADLDIGMSDALGQGLDFSSLDLDNDFLASFGKQPGQGHSPNSFGAGGPSQPGGQTDDDLNAGDIDFSGFNLYTDLPGFGDYDGLSTAEMEAGASGAGVGAASLLGIGLDSAEKDGIVDMGGALDFDELFKDFGDDAMDTDDF